MDKISSEIIKEIAEKAKARRLAFNFTQEGLAKRSGVSLGVIKLFERTGKISLVSLIKLMIPLNCDQDLNNLFPEKINFGATTIDELLKQEKASKKTRKRGFIK